MNLVITHREYMKDLTTGKVYHWVEGIIEDSESKGLEI